MLPRFDIDPNAKWIQEGVTVAGGNGNGSELNQLSFPFGLYVDDNQTIYVADLENDRIIAWNYDATHGQLIAGGNGEGKQSNQLNGPTDVIIDKETDNLIICDWQNERVVQWPRQNGTKGETIISDIKCRGIAMDDQGLLYVTNWEKNEVRLWQASETCRTVIAGGNGEGDRLDQLSFPTYVCVGPDHSLYISDWNNHRVIKWVSGAKEGTVVAGGQGQGNALTQLSYPFGLAVDQLGTIYVADCWNHRVVRWYKDATQGTILVGGNGEGEQRNQLNFPVGLAFDRHGNLYIGDKNNHRIQRFSLDRH